MPAIVANQQNRWKNQTVPYEFGELGGIEQTWLEARIREFNKACGHLVMTVRTNQPDYVVFLGGSNSPIGRQGGRQELKVSTTNLFHEMGHAIGLGHSYFHTAARLPGLFAGVDTIAYNTSRGTYTDFGEANAASMMAYSPTVFNASPRITAACQAAGNLKSGLLGASLKVDQDIQQARLAQLNAPSPNLVSNAPKPRMVRRGSGGNLKGSLDMDSLSSKSKISFDQPKRSFDLDDVRRNPVQAPAPRSVPELQQLKADIEIVREYWSFDDGFMLRVHPADKAAVLKVMGVT